MNRRVLLSTIPALALAACGANNTTTPAQVVADAQGIVTGLGKALNVVVAADPKLIPPDQASKDAAGLGLAQGALLAIAANLPPVAVGQSTLQTVEGYINAALNDLSAVTPALAALVPGLAVAVPLIQAAAVLAPIVEMFANPAGAPVASLRAKALAPAMSVERARATLGVRGG